MATVDVLAIVDVEGALTSGNLTANIYLADTNKYMGSGSEGAAELRTKLKTGDTIVWSVAPIDPGTNVSIKSFFGIAINEHVIAPVQDPLSPMVWESLFQPPGGTAPNTSYQYSMTMAFENNKELSFDPFLIVA